MPGSCLKTSADLFLKLLIALAILVTIASLAAWNFVGGRKPRVELSVSEVLTEATWFNIDNDYIQIDPAGKRVRMTWQQLSPNRLFWNGLYQTMNLESETDAESYSITGQRMERYGLEVNGTVYITYRYDYRNPAAAGVIPPRYVLIRFGEGASVQPGEAPREARNINDHLPEGHLRRYPRIPSSSASGE